MYFPVPPHPDNEPDADGRPTPKPLPAISTAEEGDLRDVVGPNADFYLAFWQNTITRRDTSGGFNRAAFFLSFFWLGYRRMYWRAYALFGIIIAETVLEAVVFCGILGFKEPPGILVFIVAFTIAVACGANANRWYLAHARRVIAEVRDGNPPKRGDRDALATRGGTDFAGGVAVVFSCYAIVFILNSILESLLLLIPGK